MKKYTEEQHAEWIKNETTQYLLRFSNSSGVPTALKTATDQTGEKSSAYMKAAIVQRLKNDGFLWGEVILNMNDERHKKKLERIEQEQEKKKKE